MGPGKIVTPEHVFFNRGHEVPAPGRRLLVGRGGQDLVQLQHVAYHLQRNAEVIVADDCTAGEQGRASLWT